MADNVHVSPEKPIKGGSADAFPFNEGGTQHGAVESLVATKANVSAKQHVPASTLPRQPLSTAPDTLLLTYEQVSRDSRSSFNNLPSRFEKYKIYGELSDLARRHGGNMAVTIGTLQTFADQSLPVTASPDDYATFVMQEALRAADRVYKSGSDVEKPIEKIMMLNAIAHCIRSKHFDTRALMNSVGVKPARLQVSAQSPSKSSHTTVDTAQDRNTKPEAAPGISQSATEPQVQRPVPVTPATTVNTTLLAPMHEAVKPLLSQGVLVDNTRPRSVRPTAPANISYNPPFERRSTSVGTTIVQPVLSHSQVAQPKLPYPNPSRTGQAMQAVPAHYTAPQPRFPPLPSAPLLSSTGSAVQRARIPLPNTNTVELPSQEQQVAAQHRADTSLLKREKKQLKAENEQLRKEREQLDKEHDKKEQDYKAEIASLRRELDTQKQKTPIAQQDSIANKALQKEPATVPDDPNEQKQKAEKAQEDYMDIKAELDTLKREFAKATETVAQLTAEKDSLELAKAQANADLAKTELQLWEAQTQSVPAGNVANSVSLTQQKTKVQQLTDELLERQIDKVDVPELTKLGIEKAEAIIRALDEQYNAVQAQDRSDYIVRFNVTGKGDKQRMYFKFFQRTEKAEIRYTRRYEVKLET